MAQGIYIQVRHRTGCKATGQDARRCRCAPKVRVRVTDRHGERVWQPQLQGEPPRGWTRADLNRIVERLNEGTGFTTPQLPDE